MPGSVNLSADTMFWGLMAISLGLIGAAVAPVIGAEGLAAAASAVSFIYVTVVRAALFIRSINSRGASD